MDKDYFIKLTLGVYRVTKLFPQEEPLKLKIREKANEILANLVLYTGNPVKITSGEKRRISEDVFQDMEIIKGYFKVAEGQDWIDASNFLFLKKEYNKVKRGMIESQESNGSEAKEEPKQENHDPVKINEPAIVVSKIDKEEEQQLSDRQKKVLQLLQKLHKVKVGELTSNFANISKRTLQRDLEVLVSRGFIIRNGNHNGIFYQYKDKQKNQEI